MDHRRSPLLALVLALALAAQPVRAADQPTATAQVEPTAPPADPPTPTPTPTPSPNATPTPTATATPTVASTATATPAAASPTAPPTATATAPPIASPAPSAPALQQAGGLRLEIVKTLEGSDLVQVGAYLTFTIRISNTGSITVTTLPLIDEYDPAVLQPALGRFSAAPTGSAPGRIDWADLTDLAGFGDLPPGGSFTITTVFRAIGISDEVINRARVEAAVGSGGEGGVPVEGSGGGEVEGGRVTIEKALVPGVIRADAPAVTFTITVRNDGAADLLSVPVEDVFDPAFLRFISAVPAPDRSDPATGLLAWDNILAGVGVARLRPGEVVTATTTFAVLAPIDNLVVNRAGGRDVRDEFGNAVQAPRQADVRIRIVGVADTRPTATATPAEERRRSTATPTEASVATAAATQVAVTATAEASVTAVAGTVVAEGQAAGEDAAGGQGSGPVRLPETGAPEPGWPLIIVLALCGLGLALLTRRKAGGA